MEQRLLSTGGLAAALGVSISAVKKWERLGIIRPALRLTGSDRRVYRESEIEAIRKTIEERRQQRKEAPTAA